MAKSRAGESPPSSVWTRSPSENFIKYTLTDDTGIELAKLVKQLDALGIILPERDLDYLKKLEYELCERQPEPFRPKDLRHAPSQRFLHDQEIWSMWHPDRSVNEAVAAFNQRNAREHICSLLTAGFGATQISHLLATSLALPISEGGIEAYRHYFWKADLLTSTERETIFQSAKAGPIVATAYKSGSSLIGRSDILQKLGHHVEETSTQAILREARRKLSSCVALVDDQPSSRRPRYLLDLLMAVETSERTGAMTQGESIADVFIKLSEHIHNQRRSVTGVDSTALSTPGFRPKGLPGRRGDLEIVDAEGVEDGNVSRSGKGTGQGGVQEGSGR